MPFNFLNLFRLVFSILYSYSNCVSICCVANISLLNASYSVVDWLALIIPLFVFVINLVLHLFTFYSFLVFPSDGKRAPTAIGRGSFPRSRTGCDIFGFGNHLIATMPDNNLILCSRAGYVRLLLPLLQVLSSFNLMQPYRQQHDG
jgi:hypothetical protein